MRGYKIFSGTANPALSKKISHYLSLPLSEATVKRFSDGEISVQIGESVRGKDVFVIDLGPRRLTDKLRTQLSRYNANIKDGHIRRLYVMSSDGTDLVEISLV